MSFEFKFNGKFLNDRLKARYLIFLQKAQKTLRDEMQFFEADIVENQMSGRKTPGFGLKIGDGPLSKSWKVLASGTLENYKVKLGTRIKYARIHQYGGYAKPSVYIPKRLYILEEFKLNGRKKIMEALEKDISASF